MTSEAVLRLTLTVLVFAALALCEWLGPRRSLGKSRAKRWPGNLLIAISNSVLVRFLLPWFVPVLVAQQAAMAGQGLFNSIGLPSWLELVISLLLLDLLIYWQHRLFHRIPLLWRLHRMHHTDTAVDVTTALRFHPLEIALSLLIKAVAVWLLGAPVIAVLMFEVMLNGFAMFNHANLRLPLWLDARLRKVVVTPDMHRVHHSQLMAEHNSNFGFNLSCWDRWFGSYIAQPKAGHQQMLLGLSETNRQQTGSVMWMLKQPFK